MAESGAMVSMSPTIQLDAAMSGGGMMGAMKSALGGESLYRTTFSAETGPGEVTLAPGALGDIMAVELTGQKFYVQPGSYLAGDASLSINIQGSARECCRAKGYFCSPCKGGGCCCCRRLAQSIRRSRLGRGVHRRYRAHRGVRRHGAVADREGDRGDAGRRRFLEGPREVGPHRRRLRVPVPGTGEALYPDPPVVQLREAVVAVPAEAPGGLRPGRWPIPDWSVKLYPGSGPGFRQETTSPTSKVRRSQAGPWPGAIPPVQSALSRRS